MTNFNSDLPAVLQLLSEIRTTQLDQAKDLGRIGADITALAGPTGRVTQLERTNIRQWWLTAAVGPVLLAAHGIARKLGVNV